MGTAASKSMGEANAAARVAARTSLCATRRCPKTPFLRFKIFSYSRCAAVRCCSADSRLAANSADSCAYP
jgi:hypothetical protein